MLFLFIPILIHISYPLDQNADVNKLFIFIFQSYSSAQHDTQKKNPRDFSFS